jgi:hypothetical protein
MKHVNVGDLVKEKELHEGWNEEFQAWTPDEDKVGNYICTCPKTNIVWRRSAMSLRIK